MEWLEQVEARLRRKNAILFRADDRLLRGLSAQVRAESRITVVAWALALGEEIAALLAARYPGEKRLREASVAAKQWAAGEIRMPQARRAILDCHRLARELSSAEDAALCHALAQGCSTVHSVGHAMGLPIYELTALVRRLGPETCTDAVQRRVCEYSERLVQARAYARSQGWAAFLWQERDGCARRHSKDQISREG